MLIKQANCPRITIAWWISPASQIRTSYWHFNILNIHKMGIVWDLTYCEFLVTFLAFMWLMQFGVYSLRNGIRAVVWMKSYGAVTLSSDATFPVVDVFGNVFCEKKINALAVTSSILAYPKYFYRTYNIHLSSYLYCICDK